MFDNLSEKLGGIFRNLRGFGKLNESNISQALKEVQMALLEADVNFKVVKKFIADVKERALGQEVLKSLTPGQQVIKIVNEELQRLMGEKQEKLQFASNPPTVIMLVGLQGSGKTTTAAKLAKQFQKEGKRPLLIPADVYRPAAIDQLKTLGSTLNIDVYDTDKRDKPVKVCSQALKKARKEGQDVLLIDTAGRLHIDEALMEELRKIKKEVSPHEILFVADAMTGQDAVNVAEEFNKQLDISGVILTKMDGDARGGAALSIKAATGKAIKFVGIGEKLEALEPFHPERMASRILGMGDILSLIEKAEEAISEEKAALLEKKILEESFTLEDFKDQILQMRKMGPLDQILGMLPGMGALKQLKNMQVDESAFFKIEAMINSMTMEERRNHTIINSSRKKRISKGSGTTVQDINRLLKQFVETRRMMKQITRGKTLPFGLGKGSFPFK